MELMNWISVKDNLPKEYVPVRVWLRCGRYGLPADAMFEGCSPEKLTLEIRQSNWAFSHLVIRNGILRKVYSYLLEESDAIVTHWKPLEDSPGE